MSIWFAHLDLLLNRGKGTTNTRVRYGDKLAPEFSEALDALKVEAEALVEAEGIALREACKRLSQNAVDPIRVQAAQWLGRGRVKDEEPAPATREDAVAKLARVEVELASLKAHVGAAGLGDSPKAYGRRGKGKSLPNEPDQPGLE